MGDDLDNAKVEGKHIMLAKHADMFSPVCTMLKWKDDEVACPSYHTLSKSWREATEDDFDSLLSDCEVSFTKKEQVSFEIVKEICFHTLQLFFQKAESRQQALEVRRQKIVEAMARPQIEQRTQAWYDQGREVLTASEFSTLYSSPRAIGQLALVKGGPPPPLVSRPKASPSATLTPFEWGMRFEPVVKQYLEHAWAAEIRESGRIIHAQDPLIAASPDGFLWSCTDEAKAGSLLEIKCPISRTIGTQIPFDYWCQMQIQMEVTDIEACEYVEVKIESAPGAATDAPAIFAGELWVLEDEEGALSYAYTAKERDADPSKRVRETVPWKIVQVHAKTVYRDRRWYASTEDLRTKFWELVEKVKRGEYELPASSRAPRPVAQPAPQVCLIQDD
jgi:hypothetical protein